MASPERADPGGALASPAGAVGSPASPTLQAGYPLLPLDPKFGLPTQAYLITEIHLVLPDGTVDPQQRYLLVGERKVGVLNPATRPPGSPGAAGAPQVNPFEKAFWLKDVEMVRIKMHGCDPENQLFIKLLPGAGTTDLHFLGIESTDNNPPVTDGVMLLRILKHAVYQQCGRQIQIRSYNPTGNIAEGGQVVLGERVRAESVKSREELERASAKRVRPPPPPLSDKPAPPGVAAEAAAPAPMPMAAPGGALPRSPEQSYASPPPARPETRNAVMQAGSGRWREDDIRAQEHARSERSAAASEVRSETPARGTDTTSLHGGAYGGVHPGYVQPAAFLPYPPLPVYSSPPQFVQEYIDWLRPHDPVASGMQMQPGMQHPQQQYAVHPQQPHPQQMYHPQQLQQQQQQAVLPPGMGVPAAVEADYLQQQHAGHHGSRAASESPRSVSGTGVVALNASPVQQQRPMTLEVSSPNANVRINLHVNFVNLSDVQRS